MKKITIRRLDITSFARFVGAAQSLWGLVIGFFSMFAGISAVLTHNDLNSFEKIFGTVAVVLFCLLVIPLVAFIIGWLYGAILALIANLFLETSHGIELDIDEERSTSKSKD